MFDVLSKINWSPLFISLKTGFCCNNIYFHTWSNWCNSSNENEQTEQNGLLMQFFTMPLVLPPTVAGYLIAPCV